MENPGWYKKRQTLYLLGFSLFLYMAFQGKGITYDEIIYLDYAERLSFNPARCQVDDYLFQGSVLEDYVVFESTHPPLIPYFLKCLKFLFGEEIGLFRLFFLIFLWLALFAIADLLVRWTGHDDYHVLGLVLGPFFLPASNWLMTDMPLVAFWTAAVALMLRCFDARPGSRELYVLAGLTALAIGAACFTAYQGLGLLPILLLAAAYRRCFRVGMVIAAIAMIPFVLWLIAVWMEYGIFPYFAPPRESLSIATEVHKGLVWENVWIKGRLIILYSGAALFFYAAAAMLSRWRHLPLWLGWGGVLAYSLFPDMDSWARLYPWLLLTAGSFILATALKGLPAIWRDKTGEHASKHAILLLWLAGFAAFQVLFAAFAAPRYVLLMLVPIWLLLFIHLSKKHVVALHVASAASFILGFFVAYAEMDYANAQNLEKVAGLDEYGTIYVAGEKGVRYSAEKLGHHYYHPGVDDDVTYLLVTNEIDRIPISESLFAHAEEVASFPYETWRQLRVMNRANNAGFYIHTRGLLPFTLGSGPLENYTLYRIFHEVTPDYLDSETRKDEAAGPILPDTPVSQEFTCEKDGLSRLGFFFATYRRADHAPLILRLHSLNENGQQGEIVFEQEVEASSIEDNSWVFFDLPPLRSAGQTYRVELSSPLATPTNAITVWSNRNAAGSFRRGGQVFPGLLAFKAFRGPSL